MKLCKPLTNHFLPEHMLLLISCSGGGLIFDGRSPIVLIKYVPSFATSRACWRAASILHQPRQVSEKPSCSVLCVLSESAVNSKMSSNAGDQQGHGEKSFLLAWL